MTRSICIIYSPFCQNLRIIHQKPMEYNRKCHENPGVRQCDPKGFTLGHLGFALHCDRNCEDPKVERGWILPWKLRNCTWKNGLVTRWWFQICFFFFWNFTSTWDWKVATQLFFWSNLTGAYVSNGWRKNHQLENGWFRFRFSSFTFVEMVPFARGAFLRCRGVRMVRVSGCVLPIMGPFIGFEWTCQQPFTQF